MRNNTEEKKVDNGNFDESHFQQKIRKQRGKTNQSQQKFELHAKRKARKITKNKISQKSKEKAKCKQQQSLNQQEQINQNTVTIKSAKEITLNDVMCDNVRIKGYNFIQEEVVQQQKEIHELYQKSIPGANIRVQQNDKDLQKQNLKRKYERKIKSLFGYAQSKTREKYQAYKSFLKKKNEVQDRLIEDEIDKKQKVKEPILDLNESPYNILGISPFSNEFEIKQKYRKLAAKYHPDKGGNSQSFYIVQSAYDVLKDKKKKSIYDQYGWSGLQFFLDYEYNLDVDLFISKEKKRKIDQLSYIQLLFKLKKQKLKFQGVLYYL